VHNLAMIGAFFVSLVVANVAGHQADHAYYVRFHRPAPNVALLGMTFVIGSLCFVALMRFA
jgi:hypothetical protein